MLPVCPWRRGGNVRKASARAHTCSRSRDRGRRRRERDRACGPTERALYSSTRPARLPAGHGWPAGVPGPTSGRRVPKRARERHRYGFFFMPSIGAAGYQLFAYTVSRRERARPRARGTATSFARVPRERRSNELRGDR